MKQKQFIISLFLAVSFGAMGQSLGISGNVNTSSSVTFTSSTAGDIPIILFSGPPLPVIFSSTSQSLNYSWFFHGVPYDPNTYLYGDILVKSSVDFNPLGLGWTIKAATPSENRFGISTGIMTLGLTDQTIIHAIWSTMSSAGGFEGTDKQVNNILTQKLSIINFADLHPTGASGLTITITYTLQ